MYFKFEGTDSQITEKIHRLIPALNWLSHETNKNKCCDNFHINIVGMCYPVHLKVFINVKYYLVSIRGMALSVARYHVLKVYKNILPYNENKCNFILLGNRQDISVFLTPSHWQITHLIFHKVLVKEFLPTCQSQKAIACKYRKHVSLDQHFSCDDQCM